MSQKEGKAIGGSWHRCRETSGWTCQKYGRRDGLFKTSEWFATGSTGSNRRNYSHLVQVGHGQYQSHLRSMVGFGRLHARPMCTYDSYVPMVPWFQLDPRFRGRSRLEKNKGSADVLGTRTFSVRTVSGVWKRHKDQLQSRTTEQTGSTTEPVGLPPIPPAASPILQFDGSAPIIPVPQMDGYVNSVGMGRPLRSKRLTTTAAVLSILCRSQATSSRAGLTSEDVIRNFCF